MKRDPKIENPSSEDDFSKWLEKNSDIAEQMVFDRCYAIGKEPNEVTEEDARVLRARNQIVGTTSL